MNDAARVDALKKELAEVCGRIRGNPADLRRRGELFRELVSLDVPQVELAQIAGVTRGAVSQQVNK